jgi:UDP-2-acetamido-3-amino-2,3-dideoxy-glucuronate N-acetyltransferase
VNLSKNIGVIGTGYWGSHLVRNLHRLGALSAAYDKDRGRLDELHKRYPDVLIHESWNAVLADPNIRALVISTPAGTHFPLAKEALLAGKDVMVEKPLALHRSEGQELVSLANERRRILMVGHVLRYHPAIAKIKEMIGNGEIGAISYIYSNRLNLGRFRTEENILWSFAPHDISVILHLLDETPESVRSTGGSYLHADIADVTLTSLSFSGGVRSHIFVSWLHPYKEQKLVIVGDKRMLAFDDVSPEEKLVSYEHKIDWLGRTPVPRPEKGKVIAIDKKEPLEAECEHFIRCVEERITPQTDGEEGLRVLSILEACQKSLEGGGKPIMIAKPAERPYFVHETSVIDEPGEVGEGTKIWHFSHILKNCRIGKSCTIGQNACIGPDVSIGNNVKIQNNVSVYEGVTLEDDVFCGPSMVFTNVINPRSHWPRKDEFRQTLVKKGATLGANSTIVCGHTVGRYSFVGAGALVNRDVPDYALVFGVPGRVRGWVCYCGAKLDLSVSPASNEDAACPACGRKYHKEGWQLSEAPEK